MKTLRWAALAALLLLGACDQVFSPESARQGLDDRCADLERWAITHPNPDVRVAAEKEFNARCSGEEQPQDAEPTTQSSTLGKK